MELANIQNKELRGYRRIHGRRNGGGQGEIAPPPNILPTTKIKSLKITTYKSVYKVKIGS